MKNRGESAQQLRFPQIASGSRSEDYVDSVLNMSADDVERLRAIRPKKLGILCSRSECKERLHSFGPRPSRADFSPGPCVTCGVEVVPWNLMHAHDLTQVNLKIDFLKTEWIRHFFFNLPVTPRIEQFAETKGLQGLETAAHHQLSQKRMVNFDPVWDRRQTKMLDGNIVHWARHAMGCCCRQCLAYWHKVPLGATLNASDIDYFRKLLMIYIKSRVPSIGDDAPVFAPARVAAEQFSEVV
jgi:hypothetical protein